MTRPGVFVVFLLLAIVGTSPAPSSLSSMVTRSKS